VIAKDQSILELLERLDLPRRGWLIVDYWDADSMAIGIASSVDPRTIVYVSTFEKEPDRYYYECEVGTGEQPFDYTVLETCTDADFALLESAMNRHLEPIKT